LRSGGQLDQAGCDGVRDGGDARPLVTIELADPSGAKGVRRSPQVNG
jgi:hypothetical protein